MSDSPVERMLLDPDVYVVYGHEEGVDDPTKARELAIALDGAREVFETAWNVHRPYDRPAREWFTGPAEGAIHSVVKSGATGGARDSSPGVAKRRRR